MGTDRLTQRTLTFSVQVLATTACVSLAACASFPAIQNGGAPASEPLPRLSEADSNSVTLDVLTYNVEGLQWPARKGRAGDLARIGQTFKELLVEGRAPDVVLFQEVFSPAAIRAVQESGYPVIVGGPSRTRSSRDSADAKREGRRRPTKGELGFRLTGSGLVVASRYPVSVTAMDAYSRKTCAGFDCLSNKGVMLIRIMVPGLPAPVEIANTHMNARKASKVRPKRHLAAHRFQTEELAMFLDRNHSPDSPLVLGGDFNMRRSPERFESFSSRIPFEQVHRYCLSGERCDVRLSWDGDAPWMDTQDLQFFAPGRLVRIVPGRVEAMFDGSPDSPKLSDHDGFRVVYKLSWRARANSER